MNFEEVLEYLVLDNIAQWHIYKNFKDSCSYVVESVNKICNKNNIYVDEDKINKRIIELQQKFITPYYVTDNTEKSE